MVNNNASRPIELLSKDFNYTIGTQDNVQKIISNQLNIGNVSSSVILKAPDYLDETYTLQLPERKGNEGEILAITDNKLTWVEKTEPKVGPITNITYVHENLKTHLTEANDEIFPSEYAIQVNPTSPTCKLLIQFKLSYKTSIHIDNQINFIIEKSYTDDDGNLVTIRVSEEQLYGTPNATGGLISEYITNIIDTSETTKEITYKLGFKVDGDIYAEPLGVLGSDDGYKNTIVIQELNEFHDTQFNASLTYNDLNTTLSNAINSANNLFSERIEKLETEKLKVELISDNDIVKPYHSGNYTTVNVTKGALPVYDSNYQFSDALVSMYTNGLHDNIEIDYQNATSKNARVYNVNNIITTTDELSIISPNNLMLSKRHSEFEFSFVFSANEANKAVTSLMLNIEPKDNSYKCYYLDIYDASGETMLKLSSETEAPSTNHGLELETTYEIKLVKTPENLNVKLFDGSGNIVKSLDVTQDYNNSMHIGLLSNKNVTIDNIVLNTQESNNNNPTVELITNDDITTPIHSGNFTSVTITNGAMSIRNNKLLYVDSLVSLYTNGIDETFSIDFVNTTTKQGFVANIDNIITTSLDINMLSNKNLMTTKKHGDFVYSCNFKLLEVNKPVLSLLLDIEEDGNSYKYKYLDISNPTTGTMKTSADTPSNTTGFALDIAYELRIVKVADTARVYVKNLKNYTDVHVGNITGLNEEVYLGLAHNKHLSVQNIKIESDLHLHPTPFPTWETLKELNELQNRLNVLEGLLETKLDSSDISHLPSSNVPIPLGTVPAAPAGFTPAIPVHGYIPVSNQSGKQAAQLISLYAQGTDDNVKTELMTGPLNNGTITLLDTIITFDASSVEITNPSNLMTVSSVRDASVFGTFKVLSQNGPGPVIVGTYDPAANTDSLYYQITSDNAASKGSVINTNSFDISKEYDFELKTFRGDRQLYLREYGTENYVKALEDESSGSKYNAAPFGFFANSNVVLRNLRTDTHIYSQIQSFNKLASNVNPIVVKSTDVTAIALRPSFQSSNFIELVQVPNNGTWASAPAEVWAVMAWDAIGFTQNAYTVFNYTDNTPTGFVLSTLNKVIALKPSAAIPTFVTDALPVISANAASFDKSIIDNTISGIASGDVIYFEQLNDPSFLGIDPTTASYVVMWLINVVSLEITRLEVFLQSDTYDFTAYNRSGETDSVIETKFNSATDTIQLDKTIGSDRTAKIGTGAGEIANFSDFGTLPASGLA